MPLIFLIELRIQCGTNKNKWSKLIISIIALIYRKSHYTKFLDLKIETTIVKKYHNTICYRILKLINVAICLRDNFD